MVRVLGGDEWAGYTGCQWGLGLTNGVKGRTCGPGPLEARFERIVRLPLIGNAMIKSRPAEYDETHPLLSEWTQDQQINYCPGDAV